MAECWDVAWPTTCAGPALGRLNLKEVRNGIPTRTPDLRHLLDQAAGVGGFYILGADCEIGVTHGPASGGIWPSWWCRGKPQSISRNIDSIGGNNQMLKEEAYHGDKTSIST